MRIKWNMAEALSREGSIVWDSWNPFPAVVALWGHSRKPITTMLETAGEIAVMMFILML